MHYTPIERYGVVGNLETCALIADDASVDWLPFPHVESPSVFARLLDAERGGHWSIRPVAGGTSQQTYLEETNVLQTRFDLEDGELVVTDFMPVVDDAAGDDADREPERSLYRKVACPDGAVDVRARIVPRFDYAREQPAIRHRPWGIEAATDDRRLGLASTATICHEEQLATATPTVEAGEPEWFVLGPDVSTAIDRTACQRRLEETIDYWREWAHDCPESGCLFAGPWHDAVVRSALALKLLTPHETGTICAAATTSLPEEIGGVRNWDYRYNWIRDAAFITQALAKLGHVAEARSNLEWFLDRCHVDEPGEIQPLYGLHGETDLEEETLDHLSGYCDSSPVRVGNAASDQRQLDIYGELVEAAAEAMRYGVEFDANDWAAIRGIVEHVRDVWDEPDTGIWEVRSEPRQFVYSKVMCWVALDRALEMAADGGFEAPTDRWEDSREEIRDAVLERGYEESIDSFVRSFEAEDTLDATGLLIPATGFLPFADDRVQGPIDASMVRLLTADGLVDRYEGEDGLPGDEGAFLLCSFWLVDALALSGRLEEATELFESVLEYRSPIGLLAEEIDPETGRHLGNVPQAFSHVGVINSALYLGYARQDDGAEPDARGFEGAVRDFG